ncbi:hypothetical protein V6N13_039676 [Hibiscus sabdariffa]|uniref:RNase H type-1 domain-containing protein n=1 Tax=Hibiscus sabdariffa TaxID=183260 RepID=A0ABR2SVD7_9ROSI
MVGDCRSVITKLQSSNHDLSLLSALIWEIRERAKSFIACHFHRIPRSGNQVAHALARNFSSGEADLFWVEELPPSATSPVESENRELDSF